MKTKTIFEIGNEQFENIRDNNMIFFKKSLKPLGFIITGQEITLTIDRKIKLKVGDRIYFEGNDFLKVSWKCYHPITDVYQYVIEFE